MILRNTTQVIVRHRICLQTDGHGETSILPTALLRVIKSTNIAVLSELGRLPMFCSIIIAVFSFWHGLEKMPETSLLYCAYKEIVNLCYINVISWYKTVVFLSEKIGTTCNISLSRYKNLSLSVFKQYLKKFILE